MANEPGVATDQKPKRTQTSADASEELQAMKDRIDQARDLKPEGRDLHCVDCFQRGRNAAIRLILGK